MKNILGSGDKNPKNMEPMPQGAPTQPYQEDLEEEPQFFANPQLDNQDSLLDELEKLAQQEASLKQEKSTLYTFRDQLKQKIREEMEQRKRSIEQLKTEVAFMKAECEGLVKVVNSSVSTAPK